MKCKITEALALKEKKKEKRKRCRKRCSNESNSLKKKSSVFVLCSLTQSICVLVKIQELITASLPISGV